MLPVRQRRLLAGLRLGRFALFLEPLSTPGGAPWDECKRTPVCRTCGLDVEDPFHIATICRCAALAALRQELHVGLHDRISALVNGLVEASTPRGRQPDGATEAHRRAALEALDTAEAAGYWDTPGGRFVLYRLLAVAPWSGRLAQVPGMALQTNPLAAALGKLFTDTVAKPHRLRSVCNSWAQWAGGWVDRLFTAWRNAVPDAGHQDAPHNPIDTRAAWEAARDTDTNKRTRPAGPRKRRVTTRTMRAPRQPPARGATGHGARATATGGKRPATAGPPARKQLSRRHNDISQAHNDPSATADVTHDPTPLSGLQRESHSRPALCRGTPSHGTRTLPTRYHSARGNTQKRMQSQV